MSIVEVEAVDATGVMTAVFFRQPWVAQQLHEGDEVAFSGTMTFAYGFHQMKAPFFEVITTESEKMKSHAKILPVHPATEDNPLGCGVLYRPRWQIKETFSTGCPHAWWLLVAS